MKDTIIALLITVEMFRLPIWTFDSYIQMGAVVIYTFFATLILITWLTEQWDAIIKKRKERERNAI